MASNSLFLAHFSFSVSQDFSSNADSFRGLYWTYRRLLSPNFEDLSLSFRMGDLMKNPKFEARRVQAPIGRHTAGPWRKAGSEISKNCIKKGPRP